MKKIMIILAVLVISGCAGMKPYTVNDKPKTKNEWMNHYDNCMMIYDDHFACIEWTEKRYGKQSDL